MTTTNSARRDGGRGLVIEIEQEFPTTRDRIFRRWTEAEALARWFAPPGYATLHAESDPRPGGTWRMDYRAESGNHQYTEQGAFHEVDPFERLALTLTQLDGPHANPETLVTVALDDIGTEHAPRTRMRFTQSGYRSPSLRNDNEQGWQECFATLAADLSTGDRP